MALVADLLFALHARPYLLQHPALPAEVFARLRERILSSPLISRSTLMGSFQASRGFAVTFTREGLPQVERRFEALSPFLRTAVRRLANAFYLNVLVVPAGAGVGRHTDVTLRGPSATPGALPREVTVLYLHMPEGSLGGRLRLYRNDAQVGQILPQENTLVRFRGSLAHEVEALQAEPGELRASLVLEQYCLTKAAASRLPPMSVQSNAGFAAYLEDPRPSKDFIVD